MTLAESTLVILVPEAEAVVSPRRVFQRHRYAPPRYWHTKLYLRF